SRREIAERRLDRRRLIFGLVIGEARAKFFVEPFGRRKLFGSAQHPLSGNRDEALGHLANALFHAGLAILPAGAAEPIELNLCVLRAVTRDQLYVFDRQVKLGAFRIMDLETIMRRPRRGDCLDLDETPDAVIDMHDEIAGGKRRGLAQQGLRALGLAAPAHQTIAENVLLADDREVRRLETVLDPENGERNDASPQAYGLRPVGDVRRLDEPMLGEHMAEPFARSFGPGGEDDVAASRGERLDMRGCDLKHVDFGLRPLRRKVTSDARAEIERVDLALMRLLRGEMRLRTAVKPSGPFFLREIERLGLERLVIAARALEIKGALSGVVIVGDLRETLL